MARTAPCPTCRAAIDLSQIDGDGRIVCPSCGARIKLRPPAANLRTAATQSVPPDDLRRPVERAASLRDSSRQAAPAPGRWRLIVGLCSGVAVLGILSLGLLVWRPASRGPSESGQLAADANSDAKAPAEARSAEAVPANVVAAADEPAGKASADSSPLPFSGLFDVAQPFDEARAGTGDSAVGVPTRQDRTGNSAVGDGARQALAARRAKRAQAANAADLQNDRPGWQAEVDPAAAEATFSIASDLKLEVKELPYQVLGTSFPFLPVLADLNGPFAVIPPRWEKCPYECRRVETSSSPPQLVVTETPQTPIAVIDLRTGRPAGHFDWRIPFWAEPALAPDGRHLIGPYHVPLAKTSDIPPREKEALAALYMWELDSAAPPRRLPVAGRVAWYGFTGKDSVAAVIHAETTRQLQVWDVATGQRRFDLDLPAARLPPPFGVSDPAAAIQVDLRTGCVAVSPGGRFLAVGGDGLLALVSLAEQRILGSVAVPAAPNPFYWLAFSAGGDEIWLTDGLSAAGGTRLIVLDAATGRRRCQQDLEGQPAGPLLPLDKGTFVLCETRGAGQAVHFSLENPRGTPFTSFAKLLRVSAAGPVLVASGRDVVSKAQTVQALDRSVLETECEPPNPYGAGGTPQRIAVDAGGAKLVTPGRPAGRECLPPRTASASRVCQALPYAPWRASWGSCIGLLMLEGRTVFVPGAGNRRAETAVWLRLDAASGVPLAQPVRMRQWQVTTESVLPDQVAFGMSVDGERFVIGDPDEPSRIDLCTAAGMRLYGCQPFGQDVPVVWADFDAEGRLLVAGKGDVAALQAGPDSVQVIYQTSGGGYRAPFQWLPGRQLLAVSRGNSLDVVDAATGACRNRLGIAAEGIIADMAFSPDGKRAAALYVDLRNGKRLLQKRELDDATAQATIALWDLAADTAGRKTVSLSGFGFLAWAGADHLCLCTRPATQVFDLRLGAHVISYPGGMGLGKSPDERIWRLDTDVSSRQQPAASAHGSAGLGLWKATRATGPWSEQQCPFFAEDRSLVSVKRTPIRLELDLGNEPWASAHRQRLADDLQAHGYTLGGSGFVLRVQSRTVPTTDLLRFGKQRQVNIPRVEYAWELVDSQGRTAWTARTYGDFLRDKSKYYRMSKVADTALADLYDFKGKPVEEAIVEEILEQGAGLVLPEQRPEQLLLGGGEYVEVPYSMPWTYADSDSVP